MKIANFKDFIVSWIAMSVLYKALFSGLQVAFKQFDVDGGGSLSVAEVAPLLSDLGKAPKTNQQRKRLMEMIAEIDSDNTGEIDFVEFLERYL